MKLNELKAFLNSLGVRPKKGLSQNFLIDGNIVSKILSEAEVSQGDYILEIGPGPGALTEALVNRGAEVVAVELDSLFAAALKRFPITIYQEDILSFSLDKLKKKGKVVANLPYHITAAILTRLVIRRDLFTTLTVMVQEEVARRLTAYPKSGDYGSLTVFLHFYSEPRYAFRVSRSCFYPAPKVDSAVVTLTLKEPPEVDQDLFFKLVRTAFGQRRKMMKKTLAPLYGAEKLMRALEQTGINPQARPEELGLEGFLSLFNELN
ncbi:MAG: ribosomal RNA small subunit methyltransferase A [Chlamydiales bacterium]|nr:ribosomal RNA small subunit methyltransferase A [Chlamydiales bacterium]